MRKRRPTPANSHGVLARQCSRGFVRGLQAVVCCLIVLQACQTPQWPVEAPMRSPFGVRGDEFLGRMHRGIDLAAEAGTPVRPVLSGRVRSAGTMRGYGRVIWIEHGRDALSVYAHLSEIMVREGQEVTKATVIGRIGQSGNATGPHLHFEFWRWGRAVDPLFVLGKPPQK
ncbi:MAG: M23 family metallopeptidase [Gemmatimonadetes bacterium]|nr:M23 family metallopeptidase [Gemmatimonadota bacterium]MYB97420.1 M23 family metallopeptidase [Gemmatimonadota bacterium]MYI46511.1 M23 family metallopeptidase [Gemmatimonadota bacterium]